ncbi:hypothetical protein BGZ82_002210 [Podila clonocystis]|nr:hypothetical protein BGZ82_002210 [Podila clonocystis]
MTEEELEYIDGEYNEAGGEQEYYDEKEVEQEEEEYEEGEGDGNEEDGVQFGDEIQLTHEEVWDDTALIEAWDAAVKQYEVYHSKSTKEVISKPNTTTQKLANTGATSPDSVPSSKRSRSQISNEEKATRLSTTQADTKAKEIENKAGSSTSTEYTASDRKPSFKKADKPAFSHYKEHKEQQQNDKKRVKFDAPKPPKKPLPTDTPPIDAATIAYYRQMGYYYDPEYASLSSTADSEQTDPSAGVYTESTFNSKASTSATTTDPASHSHMFSPYGPHHAHNPYMHHGYPPYSQGYPNHSIPHIPRGPGMPYPMVGIPDMRSPFRSGAMPGFPMPPPPSMPITGTSAGPDDETLGNLMMAWYFSGYYTGLYQAQRRQ